MQNESKTMPTITPLRLEADCQLDRLVPYEDNPRLNDRAVDAVERSLSRFGPVSPIIVDEEYRICCGHTRYKAARSAGRSTFPVLVCRFPDDQAFRAYNIADNKTAEIADWDEPALADILAGLLPHALDPAALGFDQAEVNRLLELADGQNFAPATEDDQSKLDQKNPITCPNCGAEFVPEA